MISDLSFYEIFEHYTYPAYLRLRRESSIPLTDEQQNSLKAAQKWREARIRTFRLKQSQAELDRKANKACCYKSKLWTQEEFDAASKEAVILGSFLRGEDKP